jgi:hypothetical protein
MRPRNRILAPAAATATATATTATTSADESAVRKDGIGLTFLGRYSSGSFDESAAEITAYDAGSRRLFTVNAKTGTVDILDLSDPARPRKTGELATRGAQLHPGGGQPERQAAARRRPRGVGHDGRLPGGLDPETGPPGVEKYDAGRPRHAVAAAGLRDVTNDVHAGAATVSTGPLGTLESRTGTTPVWASHTSTQSPPSPLLYVLLRHAAAPGKASATSTQFPPVPLL